MDFKKDNQPVTPNGWALLPLGVFFLLYLLTWIYTGNMSQMPVSVAFLAASLAAILFVRSYKISHKIDVFCHGAGSPTILLMVLIFILAGAFASTANAMGAVDETVYLILCLLPDSMILGGIFLAACFISMSMGTSCGTIAALTPIAVGLSAQTGTPIGYFAGLVVGGAMFGDNLSFISDTTIAATRTQGCDMRDKFKVNIQLVWPVAVFVFLLYLLQGQHLVSDITMTIYDIKWLKVLPYLVVLITAMLGMNVVLVLSLGIVLSGVIGLLGGDFTVWGWTAAMSKGMVSDMGELIIVSLLAGGMFEVIRYNGGIDWIMVRLTRNLHSKRSAELCIGALVTFTDFCTANNTIAILICGPIAKQISDKFQLDNRRVASLLDTFSCFAQAIIPYGAQLLIAAGLARINPIEIIPYLYYPFLIGLVALLAVLFQFPKKYTR